MTIKGASANFKSTPYYYTKGNTLIIYEGNDNTYVDKLNTMYTPYTVS